MAFLTVIVPSPKMLLRTQLHAIGRAESDAEMRANFRLIAAVLLAHWGDDHNSDLTGLRGNIFDIVTNEFFYTNGYAKVKDDSGESLWMCSYIGFEKVTSQWAKKLHPPCGGYMSMRISVMDAKSQELQPHTIQIYF